MEMEMDIELIEFYKQQGREEEKLRTELRNSELVTNIFVERIYADIDADLSQIYETVCKSHEEHKKTPPSRLEFVKGEYFSDGYTKSDVTAGIYNFLFSEFYREGKMPIFSISLNRAEHMWEVKFKED